MPDESLPLDTRFNHRHQEQANVVGHLVKRWH
jgi:hypothetical protein